MPGSVTVSILVVTYDHAGEIDACLDAALAQASDALAVEVVVADNASADGTADRVRAREPEVRLLEMGSNRGFAAAMNAAFAASTGELVLILNPDCAMDPACAAALADHLAARPDVAVAAALLRDPDGGAQLFARRDVDLGVTLWAFTHVGRRVDERWRGGRGRAHRRYEELWAGGPPTEPFAVYCPAAACVLAARADLAPAPFDERFPLFFNDGDLYSRLLRAGRGIEVVPAATAVHGYGTSVARAATADPARMRAEWVASLLRYTGRYWRAAPRAALRALLLADAAAVAALALAGRGGDPAFVRGTLGGLGLPAGARPLLSGLSQSER